jgi:hypothetical protein
MQRGDVDLAEVHKGAVYSLLMRDSAVAQSTEDITQP